VATSSKPATGTTDGATSPRPVSPPKVMPAHSWPLSKTDIRRGSWIDPRAGRMRVHELAAEWMASDPTKRESTTAREELTLRLHVLPTVGGLQIERVGPQDMQRLVNEWSATYAPRTVKRNYEVVRAMFGYVESAMTGWPAARGATSSCHPSKGPAATNSSLKT